MTIQENPLFKEAIEFATFHHRTQKRKYTGEPYINHPLKVAQRTYDLYMDRVLFKEMVMAAVLHDGPEDVFMSFDEIRRKFGQMVAFFVMGLTSPSKQYPETARPYRKQMDREWLIMQPCETISIKCLDMADNLKDLSVQDVDFSKKYAREKLDDVLAVMDSGNCDIGDPALRAACEEIAKILEFPTDWIYRRPFGRVSDFPMQ